MVRSLEAVDGHPRRGCVIHETGSAPGVTDGDPTTPPASLSITCDGVSTVLHGNFSHKHHNDFDIDKTGVGHVLVVDDNARVWHRLPDRGKDCLTIQDLDALDPDRDECKTVEAQDADQDVTGEIAAPADPAG